MIEGMNVYFYPTALQLHLQIHIFQCLGCLGPMATAASQTALVGLVVDLAAMQALKQIKMQHGVFGADLNMLRTVLVHIRMLNLWVEI